LNEGKLNQNLFGNKTVGAGLTGDVQLRLQQNALLPSIYCWLLRLSYQLVLVVLLVDLGLFSPQVNNF